MWKTFKQGNGTWRINTSTVAAVLRHVDSPLDLVVYIAGKQPVYLSFKTPGEVEEAEMALMGGR
jgi:hypothetical protein